MLVSVGWHNWPVTAVWKCRTAVLNAHERWQTVDDAVVVLVHVEERVDAVERGGR